MIHRLITALTVACFATASFAATADEMRAKASAFFQPLPDRMPGSEKDTPELVRLGERLFHEKNLSMNRTQSCNSCHQVDPGRGGVDNEPTSPGAFGKRGGRNSPTVLNAGFHLAQFWDGRAATLEDQAKGPVMNPTEMAMPSEAEVVKRLGSDETYVAMFKAAFPGNAAPLSYDNYAKAVAAFERTLITRDRFDDFLKGDNNALTAAELKGLDTFISTGCIACHNGPLIGAGMFQKIGIANPYANSKDLGRFEITKNENDKLFFKVPSLRNIALTGPYFHDGSVSSLDEAVKNVAWLQLGKKLTDEEVKSIVAFLHTLSDKTRAAAKRTAAN